MKQLTIHEEQLIPLRRIEGQIRGIQKMVEEERYCVDILTQLRSIEGAIFRVEKGILRKHLAGCVASAFKGKSESEKQQKINEIIGLVTKFRKST